MFAENQPSQNRLKSKVRVQLIMSQLYGLIKVTNKTGLRPASRLLLGRLGYCFNDCLQNVCDVMIFICHKCILNNNTTYNIRKISVY